MGRSATEMADSSATPVSGRSGARLGLGIDVGGTGIKSALVDLATGSLVTRRVRMDTPHPATPEAVTAMIVNVVSALAAEHPLPQDLPVGCGLPGVVKNGYMLTAANLDRHWIGLNAEDFIGAALGRRVHAINDADAAAIAEVRIGAGRGFHGTILLLTVGTGIGSGLLFDGWLVPNTEFGHIEIKGKDAEGRLSGAARERRRLRWKAWALEFNAYVARLESYVWPDLIILGGGVSKVIRRYREWLKSRAPIVPAEFLNTAGIIGAAMAAADREAPPVRRQRSGAASSKVAITHSAVPEADGPKATAAKGAASKGAASNAAAPNATSKAAPKAAAPKSVTSKAPPKAAASKGGSKAAKAAAPKAAKTGSKSSAPSKGASKAAAPS